MGRRDAEREALLASPDREAYLLAGSNLPGPRANLELLDAAGDVLTRDEAEAWAGMDSQAAVPNTPREFLACCGVVALGRLAVEGDRTQVARLRVLADDPRWRIRESTAIALQRWGDADLAALLAEIEEWARGGTLTRRRAAVAAICEPRLLRTEDGVRGAARILDAATSGLAEASRPRGEPGRVLGAALGYGWSVAIAADPSAVIGTFGRWVDSDDPDIRRMVRENLSKARFARAAPEAVAAFRSRLA